MSLSNYCQTCKHNLGVRCEAFPEGIPQSILSGEETHETPWPDQKNDIVHEPGEYDFEEAERKRSSQ